MSLDINQSQPQLHQQAESHISRKVLWRMFAFVASSSAIGYALVGTPSAWHVGPTSVTTNTSASSGASSDSPRDATPDKRAMNANRIQHMVDGLAAKLKAEPNNPEGWAMLARSYTTLRQFELALPAYRKAIELRPDTAQLYADYADALAVTQGHKLDGEPVKLIDMALKLDAKNFKALSLSGAVAYGKQDYKTAALQWARAVQHAPADNPELIHQMRSAMEDARQRAGLSATALKAAQSR